MAEHPTNVFKMGYFTAMNRIRQYGYDLAKEARGNFNMPDLWLSGYDYALDDYEITGANTCCVQDACDAFFRED